MGVCVLLYVAYVGGNHQHSVLAQIFENYDTIRPIHARQMLYEEFSICPNPFEPPLVPQRKLELHVIPRGCVERNAFKQKGFIRSALKQSDKV